MARRVSFLMFLPPAIFLLLVGVFLIGLNRDDPDQLPTALKGKQAPELTVTPLGMLPLLTDPDIQNEEVKLVNFWASWCAPCRAEHPNLEALSKTGVVIHGINYKDDETKALGFLQELGNPYRKIGADTTGRTGLNYGLYGVPETFVISQEGRIVLRHAGPITQSVLENSILPAIKAAKQK